MFTLAMITIQMNNYRTYFNFWFFYFQEWNRVAMWWCYNKTWNARKLLPGFFI